VDECKPLHSGADLNECVDACAGRLGGVSGALEYVRKMQGGGGDVIDLLTASLEARHELRGAGLAEASDPDWVRELLYLDLAIDEVARRAVERAGEANYDLEGQMRLAGVIMESLALSLPSSNEDVVLALMEWKRVEEARRAGDLQWALRAKAVVDRVRMVGRCKLTLLNTR
jgi:alpha-glucan,water dikinase